MFVHTPQHDFYTKLGEKALKENVTFDVYLGVPHSSESIDLASLSKAVQITGGDIVYFSRFNAQRHAEKLYYELFRNISRPVGTDVAIKARCSTGFTVTQYFGSFGLHESVDFHLSSIHSDKSFGFTLRND
jgi:protein transport protein SEC24